MKQRSTPTQVWTFILISSLAGLVISALIGAKFGSARFGLFIGFLILLFAHVLIFAWGDGILLQELRLEPLRGRDPWGFRSRLKEWTWTEGLVGKDGLEISILKSDLPTAFSFDFPFGRPILALSEGLIRNFSPEEVEMVFVHQLCQLQHRLRLRFAFLSLLANTFAQMALSLDRIWIPNSIFGRAQRPFVLLFSPLISLLVHLSHSRQDQFVIDQQAAQLIGSREKLGRLLWRLENWSLTHPMEVVPATSHLFIVNPERIRQKNRLLRFHPPIQVRLEKLVGAFPV